MSRSILSFRRSAGLCAALLISACGGVVAGPAVSSLSGAESGEIPFESSDGYDFDALATADRVTVSGLLETPAASARAVAILSHGSGGRGAHHARWASWLREEGVATFSLDHFSARGVLSTVHGQVRVTEQQMTADIVAAAKLLKSDPRFADLPFLHMGWSKGGTASLLAAVDRYAAFADPAGSGIDLFLPFYPFCGFTGSEQSSARIRVFHGAEDDWTLPGPCEAFVEILAKNGADAEIRLFDDARHGFDSWQRPFRESPKAVTVRDTSAACMLEVGPDGVTRSVDGSASVDSFGARRAFLTGCAVRGVTSGGSPQHRLAVEAEIRSLLDELAPR